MSRYAGAALLLLGVLITSSCRTAVEVPPQFWNLTESERMYYFGMLALDSSTARTFLNLEYQGDRRKLLDAYWQGRADEWADFQSRVSYVEKNFGKYGVINDDRARLYIRHGPPSERTVVEGKRRRISLTAFMEVRPVEVWIYRLLCREFDLVKAAGGNFRIVAETRTGDSATVRWFEDLPETNRTLTGDAAATPDFDVAIGRFRQRKGLTRLEVYIGINLADTAGIVLEREVLVTNAAGDRVDSSLATVVPRGAAGGYFIDEANFLVQPRSYTVEVALRARAGGERVAKTLAVNMLEYSEDLKLVSDLVKASVIDDGFTADKFVKPAKPRLIPSPGVQGRTGQPFYFYHEVYNLAVNADGNHRVKTGYRVFEKATRAEQIIDYVERVEEDVSATAYIAVKWRPTNLPPGRYVVFAETHDLIADRRMQTLLEFELVR